MNKLINDEAISTAITNDILENDCSELIRIFVLRSCSFLRGVRCDTNSGSIPCRPPLPELDTCACLWYGQHTCPFGHFWTLDEEVRALSRLADVWPGRVEPIESKLQSLSKFAEPEVDGFLDVLNTPDGQSQHWVPGACCSSPVQKIDTGGSSSNMSSHLHTNSSKQTFKTILDIEP